MHTLLALQNCDLTTNPDTNKYRKLINKSYNLNLDILRKLYSRYIFESNLSYKYAKCPIFRAFLKYVNFIVNDLLLKSNNQIKINIKILFKRKK